jgi:hypothetical protein
VKYEINVSARDEPIAAQAAIKASQLPRTTCRCLLSAVVVHGVYDPPYSAFNRHEWYALL